MKMTTPRPSSKQRRREHIQRATASAAHTRDPQRTTSSAVKPFQRPPISHNLQTPLVLPVTTTEWRWVKRNMRTETRKQPTTKVTTLPATQTPEGNPQRNVHVPKTRLRQRSLSSRVTGHGLYAQIGHASHVLSVTPVTRTLSKRVQVSGKSSSVTNQETDRGVSLSQAKRCSSTKR